MKIITLWQPWASLLVENKKHIETRSWATTYRGPIGIHAAMKCPLDGLLRFMDAETRHLTFKALGHTEEIINWKEGFPTGVILGSAILKDCIQITEEYAEFIRCMAPNENAFGDYTPGRFAWIMEEPIKFEMSIPAKGKQRLWEYNIPN